VDPFSKKDWYDVKAPSVFAVRNVGKTLVTRTQGTKIASDGLKGRVFETSLADLQKVCVRFSVHAVEAVWLAGSRAVLIGAAAGVPALLRTRRRCGRRALTFSPLPTHTQQQTTERGGRVPQDQVTRGGRAGPQLPHQLLGALFFFACLFCSAVAPALAAPPHPHNASTTKPIYTYKTNRAWTTRPTSCAAWCASGRR
jgi:hypothetical protein